MCPQKTLHSEGPREAVVFDWVIHDPALRLALPLMHPRCIFNAIRLAASSDFLAAATLLLSKEEILFSAKIMSSCRRRDFPMKLNLAAWRGALWPPTAEAMSLRAARRRLIDLDVQKETRPLWYSSWRKDKRQRGDLGAMVAAGQGIPEPMNQ